MSAAGGAPTDPLQRMLREAAQAMARGDLGRAGQLCRRVLAAEPDCTDAHFLVGMVARELDDRATALRAFTTVIQLQPDHAAAWAHVAWLHARGGRAAAARQAVESAQSHLARTGWMTAGGTVTSDRRTSDGTANDATTDAGTTGGTPGMSPDDSKLPAMAAATADLLGVTCSLLGDHAAAERWHQQAVAAAPARAEYRLHLANTRMFLGSLDDAETQLRAVLAAAPDHAQAHWLLGGLRTARDHAHARELATLLARPGHTDREIALYGYALGKQLEDLGDWPGAFAAYSRGAAARRATVEFAEAAEEQHFAALMSTYDADWLAAQPPGDPDPAPIFVIGQPRTGTTLVERILVAHSQVRGAGELQQFGLSVRRLASGPARPGGGRRSAVELVPRAAALNPAELGHAYLAGCTRYRVGSDRFVDKLPGNFLHVPLILAALPNARILHLVRDPMDACFASFKQLFAEAYPHSYDQVEQARHFVRYFRLMAHWRQAFPGRFLDVGYESLVQDPAVGARAIIDWVGLPWEDACLEFHRVEGAVATASAVQVRSPAHTRSVGRWRHFSAELEPMRQVLREAGIPCQ